MLRRPVQSFKASDIYLLISVNMQIELRMCSQMYSVACVRILLLRTHWSEFIVLNWNKGDIRPPRNAYQTRNRCSILNWMVDWILFVSAFGIRKVVHWEQEERADESARERELERVRENDIATKIAADNSICINDISLTLIAIYLCRQDKQDVNIG